METEPKGKEDRYGSLDEGDVVESSRKSDGTKIGQNIKSINDLTTKINQFVADKSKNIKYEIEGFRRKINSLEEQLQAERNVREKLENQLSE